MPLSEAQPLAAGAAARAPEHPAAPRRWSIRASLIGLVAACLTPALLVSAFLAYEHYDLLRERIERDTLLQARALAAHLDRELSAVQSGLRVLSTSPSLAAGDLREFHGRAREALAFQLVDNYLLTDRQGRQHLNTLRGYGEPLPEHGTPPELQRVFDERRPVLTGLFIGPVTGRPVIAMGVPVIRGDEVIYSLNVGLSPERIAAVLQRQALPNDWVAAVLDGQGTIVARTRQPEQFVGQSATPDLMAHLAAQREGALTSVSKDGVPTYAGYTHSSVSDWSVVVGAPRATVDQVLQRSVAWLLAGTLAAFAVGLAIAVRLSARVSGSIRALVEPALALGSGQPLGQPAPTQLKETEAVGQAMVLAGRMLQATRHMAEHDPLTGLPNRLLFDELAASRLAEARRHGRGLALLALDLDGFKSVNDLHGHAVGDAVLKTAAERIAGLLRESDVVARLGGDEFAVLLSDTHHDEACLVANKLIDTLSQPYPGVSPRVTASVGIALHPQAGQSVAVLCERADQALYAAKRMGKRRLSVAA